MEESSLNVLARTHPYTLVVEPWADEYVIAKGDDCRLVAIYDNHEASPFVVEIYEAVLAVHINVRAATYQFWRNGILEYTTPVRIP